MSEAHSVNLIFKNTKDLCQGPPGEGGDVRRPGPTVGEVVPRTDFVGRATVLTEARCEAPPATATTLVDHRQLRDDYIFSRNPETFRARDTAHHAGGLYRILREVRGTAMDLPHWMVGQSYAQDVRLSAWRVALESSRQDPEQVLRGLIAVPPRRPAPPRRVGVGKSHQTWTEEDRSYLFELVSHGRTYPYEAALELGRSENAVISQALRMFDRATVRFWCGGVIGLP